ncbi:hypothetical protein ACFO5K_04605 [Nocardia halotolerans]|uniref:Head-to-tail adaptor n=1 Tax=Nocardia halotolerans TaxID=1755878 RepID=A0ABV8VBQ2_9NOCA
MLTYADPDDLADGWLTELPDGPVAVRLIRYASQLVRAATRLDLYEVYPSGLPVDLDVAEAMRDATCAHAAMWHLAGIDPVAGAVGRELSIASQTADGGSVTYADSITVGEIERSLTALSPAAMRILRNAGLASTRPLTW